MVVITVTKQDNSDFRVKFIVQYHLANGVMPDPMQSQQFHAGTETLNIPQEAASMKVIIFAYPLLAPSSSSANGKKLYLMNSSLLFLVTEIF